MSFYLRAARDEDRETIYEVTLDAYSDYATQFFWDAYRQNIGETLLDIQDAAQIVAEQDGLIIGTVLLFPTSNAGGPEVRLLAVSPAARGQGVGEALVQECARHAQLAGAPVLYLHTLDEIMQPAVRLYKRMGFVRAPEFDLQPHPDILVSAYRLPLGPPAIQQTKDDLP